MTYHPRFTVTAHLVQMIEEIASFREKILSSTVQVPWIPALQKDARVRNTHSSTAIEGNPLTLEEVRILEEGRPLPTATTRSKKEILNYFTALRFIEKNSLKKNISEKDLLKLHKIISFEVMDQGSAGAFRKIEVRVGNYFPPKPDSVRELTRGLLAWWNEESSKWSPVISSAIIHYRFEAIHPFADGNGRTGRALALWELYKRGFDTHHIFSVDEFYWEDRQGYYRALDQVRQNHDDLTGWLEYTSEGMHLTLERVLLRIQELSLRIGDVKIVLRPKQEKLLSLLREKKSLSPREIWKALDISRQGAMDLLKPLIEAGIVEKIGTKKTGKYVLK
ncbi:MAG: Fic family protein [Deltaproteobacteria bacterium]|nr:Fic family protein [Deltaproteobacteria bacterium]